MRNVAEVTSLIWGCFARDCLYFPAYALLMRCGRFLLAAFAFFYFTLISCTPW